jgi:hypothetical protein
MAAVPLLNSPGRERLFCLVGCLPLPAARSALLYYQNTVRIFFVAKKFALQKNGFQAVI